jgi:hypothetical protein
MSYEFQFMGQEKEPSDEEILEGFIHHTTTLLHLYGAPKYIVAHLRECEKRKLNKQDVYEVMNCIGSKIDKIKTIISQVPTIAIERLKPDEDDD